MEIAKFYTDAFFEDFKKLNIKKPEIISPATDNIDEYIKIIEKLIDSGYAYQAGGNIYFDTSKLKNYYRLTNQDTDDLLGGVRVAVEAKELAEAEKALLAATSLIDKSVSDGIQHKNTASRQKGELQRLVNSLK